jgi:hypothetical protein
MTSKLLARSPRFPQRKHADVLIADLTFLQIKTKAYTGFSDRDAKSDSLRLVPESRISILIRITVYIRL